MAHLASQREGRRLSGPVAGAHEAVAFRHAPRHGQQQRERHVGHAVVQHVGRVADGDAALRRRGDVEPVEAHAEAGDHAQLRQRADQRPVGAAGGGRDQSVELAAARGQEGVTLRPGRRQLVHGVVLGELPLERGQHGQGLQQDGALGHVLKGMKAMVDRGFS